MRRALAGFSTWLPAVVLAGGVLGCGVLAGGVLGCGGGDGGDGGDGAADAGPRDWPSMDVPAATTPEAGVRREVFRVAGVAAPAAVDGTPSPAAYDFTQVVRYRQDAEPPVAAHAILIAYPGFLGGAGNWDPLARHLVRRSVAAGAPVEVWAIDRRSNLLEDLRGMDTAEAAGDAEAAAGWYFGKDTLDGERFPGFVLQTDVAFQAEWGLAVHVEDLRRVIQLVPAAERRARVFLMGHSLGAAFTEAYAGWRFADGLQGADELAGLVLIDGALADTPLTEPEYTAGPSGGGNLVGLDEVRASQRFFELPLLGTAVMPQAEIMSLRALQAPEAVVADEIRDETLRILFFLPGAVPAMTNQAVLGFAFDRGSVPLTFAALSLGQGTGGLLEAYDNPFGDGELVHPTDLSATYSWIDAPDADPTEVTPVANLAHAFSDGRTNFAEWYFPARLPLDLAACGGGAVPEASYQSSFGLRCWDEALVDAPLLGISAELAPLSRMQGVTSRVAPTIGAGRPLAGSDRTNPAAHHLFHVDGFTHLDPLLAADVAANPVPAAILDFVTANTAPGSVTIPTQ